MSLKYRVLAIFINFFLSNRVYPLDSQEFEWPYTRWLGMGGNGLWSYLRNVHLALIIDFVSMKNASSFLTIVCLRMVKRQVMIAF